MITIAVLAAIAWLGYKVASAPHPPPPPPDQGLVNRWQECARAHALELTPTGLCVPVAGTMVMLDFPAPHAPDRIPFVTVAVAPPGFRFSVHPRLGGGGVPVDTAFDRYFQLASNDDELAALWFGERVVRCFDVFPPDQHHLWLVLEDGRLHGSLSWPRVTAEGLARLAAFVSGVAGGWRDFCARWCAVGTRLGMTSLPEPAYETALAGASSDGGPYR